MKKIILILLLSMSTIIWGASGTSMVGKPAYITLKHVYACDSAIAYFGQAASPFDTVKLVPYSSLDSSFLVGSVSFDSIGTFDVWINYYEQGSATVSGYAGGDWENYNYIYADGSGYVTANPTSGLVDAILDEDTTGHSVPGTFGFEAVQGGMANTEEIAHAVAESLITGRGLATFGNGMYACTLFVLDESDSSAIMNTWVTIRSVSGSEILARFQTLTAGSGIAGLNTGDHAISLFNPNYIFNQIDTVTISGNQTDTLWGILFAPSPQAPYLCQVWGTIISPDTLSGTTVKAVLVDSSGNKFKSGNPPRTGNTLITRFEFSAETTSSIWQISLIPNDDITPPNTKWDFQIEYPDGTLLKLKVAVPDQPSWEFQW